MDKRIANDLEAVHREAASVQHDILMVSTSNVANVEIELASIARRLHRQLRHIENAQRALGIPVGPGNPLGDKLTNQPLKKAK